MIQVASKVNCYSVNSKKSSGLNLPQLIIRSHAVYNTNIIIETPEGQTYEVLAKDILAAIVNAENSARW